MRFAFLTPSRGRPEGLKRFVDSIVKTASGRHQIDIVIGLDEDDSINYNNLKLDTPQHIQVLTIIGQRKRLAVIWNSLIEYSPQADWYTCGNDDEEYITGGWDEIFYRKSQERHPYNMYWFDDGLQHGNHAAFPILSKEWIQEVGYYFPEKFIHNYVDTWVAEIARKLGTAIYIPQVKHQHLHHSLGMSDYDTTYADGMAGNSNEIDKRIFLETEGERDLIVEHLKSKICQL